MGPNVILSSSLGKRGSRPLGLAFGNLLLVIFYILTFDKFRHLEDIKVGQLWGGGYSSLSSSFSWIPPLES